MRKKTRLHIMAVLHLKSFIIVFIAISSATRNTQDYYKKKKLNCLSLIPLILSTVIPYPCNYFFMYPFSP